MMCRLRLYVSGSTHRTERIIGELKKIVDAKFRTKYTLEVIDVTKNPKIANRDGVLATPTLIKISPPPVKRITGDFTDKKRIISWLGLKPRKEVNRRRR